MIIDKRQNRRNVTDMERPLDNKIVRAAERAGVVPSNAMVVIDLSNVLNWTALKDDVPANENVTPSSFRVSVPMMSSYFRGLRTHPLVRVFSPHVYISEDLIREITDWVMINCPEIFNTSGFANASQQDPGFNARFAGAISEYMARKHERIEISATMRAKMSILTRAATWLGHKGRMQASGFEVVGKSVGFRGKTLLEDRAYTPVVTNVLQKVGEMQREVGEMGEVPENIGEGKESVRQLASDLDKANAIFGRVSACLAPEELAEINGLVEQFRERIARISRAAAQIKDQIVHGTSRKCDLDVEIVSATLDPRTLNKYGVFVFYGGDGDFQRMYSVLVGEGKRVIVASPEKYLARSIKEMAQRGEVELHRPNFDDNMWREIKAVSTDKRPT